MHLMKELKEARLQQAPSARIRCAYQVPLTQYSGIRLRVTTMRQPKAHQTAVEGLNPGQQSMPPGMLGLTRLRDASRAESCSWARARGPVAEDIAARRSVCIFSMAALVASVDWRAPAGSPCNSGKPSICCFCRSSRTFSSSLHMHI